MNELFTEQNDTTVQRVLAANLRRLRIARRLSLSELARATGIGKATLSAVENGNANPTVATLTALAGALQVRVSELLDHPQLGEIRVARATPANGIRAIDAFASDGPVEVAELALGAREARTLEPRGAGAREEVFVLQGTVVAGPLERITELAAGDYASFPADVERIYEAGRNRVRALLMTHGSA